MIPFSPSNPPSIPSIPPLIPEEELPEDVDIDEDDTPRGDTDIEVDEDENPKGNTKAKKVKKVLAKTGGLKVILLPLLSVLFILIIAFSFLEVVRRKNKK